MKKMLVIIPTYYCNFSCLHCGVRKSRKKQYISLLKVKKLFRIIRNQNISGIRLTGGGEPSICFEKMVRIIKLGSKHGFHFQITTNASFVLKEGYESINTLKEAGVESLEFSIDNYHLKFISYNSLIKAIKFALKSNLDVRIKMIITDKVKEKNFMILKRIVKDLGGKVTNLFPFYIYGTPTYMINIPRRKPVIVNIFKVIKTGFNNKIDFSNLKKEKLKNLIFNPCPSPVFYIVVTPKGSILPCCSFSCINNPDIYEIGNLDKVKNGQKIISYDPIFKKIIFDKLGFLKLFLRIRKNEKLKKRFLKEDFHSICDLCLLILKYKTLIRKTPEPSKLENLFFILCNFPYFFLGLLKIILSICNFRAKFHITILYYAC